jgi:Peptidase family S41
VTDADQGLPTTLRRARRGRLLSEALPYEAAAGRAARASEQDLDGGQRLLILDILIKALGGAYAHLPAKRAAYANDPIQALTLLRRRAADLSNADFHRAVSGIVTGLRDAHTRYIGPETLRGQVAVLPFLVEQYGPERAPRYLVSKLNEDAIDDDDYLLRPGETPADVEKLKAGSELTSWNGIPFARAVEIHADSETGGRPDSRLARALESLTLRALDYAPPPDEDWVVIGYRNGRGPRREVRLPWRVLAPGKAATAIGLGSRSALKVAADPAAEAYRRAKKQMYSTKLWAIDRERPTTPPPMVARPKTGEWIPTPLQDVVAAKLLSQTVGYLRIWSFDVDDDDAFVAELVRLLGALPQQGLIVDLRSNPGGLIWAAERALQLFTATRIQPTRFSLAATPLTRQMADSAFNRLELEAWNASLQDAVSTGELYAQPLPLTDPEWCNDQQWHYPGRVLAIVDANTYSSGDLFAAGWLDHDIGPLVSIGQATGAGGANVWTSHQLRDAVAGTDQSWPAMPGGTGFTIAFRRAIRSAAGDGIPIEDLGVPGLPYEMTRTDLLDGNKDLLAFCTRLLQQGRP